MSSQSVILTSMAVAVSGNAASQLIQSDDRSELAPAIKVGAAGLAITVGLLVVSEFQPKVASSIAILLMFASLLGPNGIALFDMIKNVVGPTKTPNAGGGNATVK